MGFGRKTVGSVGTLGTSLGEDKSAARIRPLSALRACTVSQTERL